MVDGRSVTARRFKDLYEDIAADLGGLDQLSEGQRQLIRRAEHELHRLVVTRMKNSPGMSYARAFTHEYLAPENRSLKERVSSEGILRMQAMAPTKPFPAYTSPGHDERDVVNVGRSGAKPRGYAGG
jgi:hypothetical protein